MTSFSGPSNAFQMRTTNPHFTNLLNEVGNLAVAVFSTMPEADQQLCYLSALSI